MEHMTVDGTTLEYQVTGQGEPVVMIHGAFIGDAFLPLARQSALTSHHRVITYRRRGYCGSPRPSGPVSMARQAADCRELLDHLDVEQAHVVGHSYGGIIALQLAMDQPDRVRTLALLEPALAVGESGPAYRESIRRGEERYRELGPAVLVDEMLRARLGRDPRAALEPVLPGALEQAVADAPTTFEVEFLAFQSWRFGEEEARKIRQPTLVVLGELSRELSPRFVDTYRWLLEHLPHPEGFELPDAAHGLQMENPGELAPALRSFYERHRPASEA